MNRRTPHWIVPVIGMMFFVAAVFGTPDAQATLVLDDFSYTPDNTVLSGQNGGSGFNGSWGASTGGGAVTGRIKVDIDENLSTTVGGYDITQTGTGNAYGDFNAFRGINRYIDTDLSGTIWFSALLKNPASDDRSGIQFNNHADAPYSGADYNEGSFHAGLYGDALRVKYGGTLGSSVATLGLNQTHLIVGKIAIGAGNDSLEVWADPADLQNLGTPAFSQSDANMGDDLYLAGVFSYYWSGSTPGGQVDALRLSDGGGNSAQAFFEVTGVPEPTTVALSAVGLLGLLACGRRRRR